MRGFDVRLYNRTPERIGPIQERGGIELLGVAGEGFAELALVTTDLAEAVTGAGVTVYFQVPVGTPASVQDVPETAPLQADPTVCNALVTESYRFTM